MPKKKSIKGKKGPEGEDQKHVTDEIEQIETEIVIEREKDIREVIVTIENYQNAFPHYSMSGISTKCYYSNEKLGESEAKLITDESIIEDGHSFIFTFDANSAEDLDLLASTPVVFVATQKSLSVDSSIILPVAEPQELVAPSIYSLESALSLYEALTGDKVETVSGIEYRKKVKEQGKKKKSQSSKTAEKKSKMKKSSVEKSSKTSKKSKDSKDKTSKKTKSQEKTDESTETIFGHCNLDLLPLLLGEIEYSEFLPFNLPENYFDDRMITFKHKPGICVSVTINPKNLDFICGSSVLNLTLESIYNIPSVMSSQMEYKVCINLPLVDLPQRPTLLSTTSYKTSHEKEEWKYWPDISKIPDEVEISKSTKYKLDSDYSNAKSVIPDLNLTEIVAEDSPRIVYNILKRNFLLREGLMSLYDHLKKYRRILIEIYSVFKDPSIESLKLSPKKSATSKKSKDNSKKSGSKRTKSTKSKDEKKGNESPTGKGEKPKGYLHLMGLVDLSPLLYPGVTKIRLACPLTTYHYEEAETLAGAMDSYFVPKPKDIVSDDIDGKKTKEAKKGKKKKEKKAKSSKKSSKSSKKSKSSKDSEKRNKSPETDLKYLLPSEPAPKPPPEPPKRVFNEQGKETFIMLEIELTTPLLRPRSIDDLHEDLLEMVHVKPEVPKVTLDIKMTEKLYKDIIKEIIKDLNHKYSEYIQEKSHCRCAGDSQADFLTYLRRTGTYQTLVHSLIKVASMIVQNKFKLSDIENCKQYQDFIDEVFVHLLTEINEVLHRTTASCDVNKRYQRGLDSLLFYAKEATELGDYVNAERYYLERIQRAESDPDVWFDYTIYKIEMDQSETGYFCLQEVLARKIHHKYGLLLNGIFLADKKQPENAETCFLNVLVQEARWVEGWVILYLFYENRENKEGMDLAEEMAKKYENDHRTPPDYFSEGEDLVWTFKTDPKTIYSRTAVLLVKLRMYRWAENALSHELTSPGFVHYLLAVICYYEKHYEHALSHLERAKYFQGTGYAATSLSGHCNLALKSHGNSRTDYSRILESFERPNDIHLVYLNYARVSEILGNHQEARKIILLACKHTPTPFSWYYCGYLYFKQRDLMSAEECFSESLMLDNSQPKPWAYLTLINLQLVRCSEAEICYRQVIKNNLTDEELLNEILTNFKRTVQ